MSVFMLLPAVFLWFAVVSLFLWFSVNRWFPRQPMGPYLNYDEPRLSLFPYANRKALLAGFLTACLFLWGTRLGIAKLASYYLASNANNVSAALLEREMGYDLGALHRQRARLNDGDFRAYWQKYAEVLNQREGQPNTDPKGLSKDPRLFTRFRTTYCFDTNDLKLVTPDPGLDAMFAALTQNPNALDGFVAAMWVLKSDERQGAPQIGALADDGEARYLDKLVRRQFEVPLFAWDLPAPRGRDILKRLGSFLEEAKPQKAHWHHYLNGAMAEGSGPAFEKLLSAHLDRMADLMTPFYRVLQMVFGFIQLLTLTLFFAGLVMLRMRLDLLNQEKTWKCYWNNRKTAEGTQGWGLLALQMWRRMRAEFADKTHAQDEAKRLKMHAWLRQLEERIEKTEYTLIDYIVWGMPSLGFIGTVLGIGAALGDADKVVRATNAVEQAGAISAVTSLLGVAFDTTLVALICGLPLTALIFALRAKESKFLTDLPDELEHAGIFAEINGHGGTT
ncbi:MotA/TolQ/ExbB proton channel family protein [Sulfidibacter corallicola]|uniref:MotA/TolQ/ExbB proton channel family protein n=1 Tax=Sulfidibacter corallicola TaxID=2818388 RepID=A0A8A4TN14_SULCO|nr:MotA/TolQ/ExbB proton channel family protein [Sulfidibacter corallicola]QTD50492.1 MotA/TolQ/ExbB proton channel family protein [Sulfidibacter corallicola]